MPSISLDYKPDQPFTVREASVVSGIGASTIRRLIHDKVLPGAARRMKGRHHVIPAYAISLVRFAAEDGTKLARGPRDGAMRALSDLFQRRDALDFQESRGALVFSDGAIRIELEPVVQDVAARMARYLRARAMVVTDRGMNGGAPTLRGTRVRVHDLAAVLANHGREEARAIYSDLTDDQMNAAELYSSVHPKVERPVLRRLPSNAQLVSRRRVALADLPERTT